MTNSPLERLLWLLDQGLPISTSLIVESYPELFPDRTIQASSVTSRMRRHGQREVSRTREKLWSPTSVRVAFPELGRVEFTGLTS